MAKVYDIYDIYSYGYMGHDDDYDEYSCSPELIKTVDSEEEAIEFLKLKSDDPEDVRAGDRVTVDDDLCEDDENDICHYSYHTYYYEARDVG